MKCKNIVYSLATMFILLNSSMLSAQVETDETVQPLTITIGDTIMFASNCDSTFRYMDLYTKTRYLDSILSYNPFTGEGFYKAFFAEGDFDAKRLPCDYAGKKYTITATQTFVDNNTGEDRFVVFVMLDRWTQVAWIELIDALENGEIIYKAISK